jgi:DNA-binding NarL/FixJ family response regulator
MSNVRPSAVIVDDQPEIRALYGSLLTRAGVNPIAEAADGESALNVLRRLRPAIAVLDILIPGPSGLEVLHQVKQEHLLTGIVLLTGHNRKDWILKGIEAGANAVLLKGSEAIECFAFATSAALTNDIFLSPSPLRMLTEEYLRLRAAESSGGLLSPREALVAKLVSRGMTNKEIACELRLSVRTIENIRSGMMKKIDAHRIADVVRYAESHLNEQLTKRGIAS